MNARSVTITLQLFMWILHLSLYQQNVSGCERAVYAADIVYLLDSSGSVKENNFKKQLDFISHFAQSVPIGPNNVQIGIESFSDDIHHHFDLDDYGNETLLQEAIQRVPYIKGHTNTAEGLRWVMNHSFTKQTGDREDVHNILIVTTDGKSDNKKKTLQAAAELHAMNLTTLCIGIGGHVANEEITSIASTPRGAIMVHDFDLLFTTVLNLSLTEMDNYACGGVSPSTPTTESTKVSIRSKTLPPMMKTVRGVEIGIVGVISSVFLGIVLCCCRKFWAFLNRRKNDDDDDDEKPTLKRSDGYSPTVSASPLPFLKDDIKIYPAHTTRFEHGEW